jgi:hypothetical protein
MNQREDLKITNESRDGLKVTNLNGKEVYLQTLSPVSVIVDLNLNSLSSGLYNLSIRQGKHFDNRNLVITR